MKVLLVQIPLGRRDRIGAVYPLGLAYVATALSRAGHVVNAIDPNIHESPYQVLGQRLEELSPDIVGISLRNIDTVDYRDYHVYYRTLNTTLGCIRTHAGSIPIVAGGPGFSLFPCEIMRRHPEITYGVVGEGETTAVELMRNLRDASVVQGVCYRSGSEVLFTGSRTAVDFNSTGAPLRYFFPVSDYPWPLSVGVQSQRGCQLCCSYCVYPTLNGGGVRKREIADVVTEIQSLESDFGLRVFAFADSLFNQNQRYAEGLCEALISKGVRAHWEMWADLENTDQEFINLAFAAGCYRICFSPDAVTTRTLRSMRKGHTAEAIRRAVNLARINKRIQFRFAFFAMPPDFDLRDVIGLLRLTLITHVVLRNSKALVGWIRVLPGTDIADTVGLSDRRMAERELLIDKKTSANIDRIFFNSPQRHFLALLIRICLDALDLARRLRHLVSPLPTYLKAPASFDDSEDDKWP